MPVVGLAGRFDHSVLLEDGLSVRIEEHLPRRFAMDLGGQRIHAEVVVMYAVTVSPAVGYRGRRFWPVHTGLRTHQVVRSTRNQH